jgi:hypothetical protein
MSGHVRDLLTAYHHGELSAAERYRVDDHVASCAKCRAEFEDIRGVVRLIARGLHSEGALSAPAASLRPPRPAFRWVWVPVFIIILTVGVYTWRQSRLPAWDVASAGGVSKLRVGRWFDTASAEATLQIENVGEVRVEPNSRLRVLESKPDEYRMELRQGTLHATVWAPPRLFFVETPSATAIDLGCAYDLSVDEAGDSVLRVTTGVVELASKGRSSIVLTGWMAKTRRHAGPGTPYVEGSSNELLQALDTIDFAQDPAAKAAALDVVLTAVHDYDVITLWHLLPRVEAESRRRIHAKMLELSSAPRGVTTEGIAQLDPGMLALWKSHLGLAW